MKSLLFSVSMLLAAQSFATNYITCGKALEGNYNLEVIIDKYETSPAKSEVNLYYGHELIGSQSATKRVINLESIPPQELMTFNFENDEFESLSINLTEKKAYMKPGYVNSIGESVKITFTECEAE